MGKVAAKLLRSCPHLGCGWDGAEVRMTMVEVVIMVTILRTVLILRVMKVITMAMKLATMVATMLMTTKLTHATGQGLF